MAAVEKCCWLASYYRVPPGNAETFRRMCEAFVAKARAEPKCLYYGFSFRDDEIHCRESYDDADGVIAHLAHVGEFVRQALKVAQLVRFEVHGPRSELAKLEAPLASFEPQFFVQEYAFRR